MLLPSFAIYVAMPIAMLCVGPCFWWLYRRFIGDTTALYECYKEVWSYIVDLFSLFTAFLGKGCPFAERCKLFLVSLFMFGVLVVFIYLSVGIARQWPNLMPNLIVVEDAGHQQVDCSEHYCIGTYKFDDGTVVSGQLGSVDIVNHSTVNVRYYGITYTSKDTPLISSETSMGIRPHEHKQVGHYPDYMFESPPPSMKSISKIKVCWVLTVDFVTPPLKKLPKEQQRD